MSVNNEIFIAKFNTGAVLIVDNRTFINENVALVYGPNYISSVQNLLSDEGLD